MGRLSKKLSKSMKNKAMLPFAQPAGVRSLNAQASILAGVVTKKITEERLDAGLKEDIWQEGFQEGFAEAIAAMCNVLMNDWGHLIKRKTRLKEAYNRLYDYREKLELCEPQQLAAEAEFTRQTNLALGREHRQARYAE